MRKKRDGQLIKDKTRWKTQYLRKGLKWILNDVMLKKNNLKRSNDLNNDNSVNINQFVLFISYVSPIEVCKWSNNFAPPYSYEALNNVANL